MFVVDPKVVSRPVAASPTRAPVCSWKDISDPIEPFLETVGARLAKQVAAFDPHIIPYADYALNGQGKHLRPTLVALVANVFGQTNETHATVAVIIEMVHLATLVHDDVMDEAEIRRGRLSLAANWGNEIAVLFGDCLFARALQLAASFPTPEICRAVASATNTVCAGEILQTQHRRDFSLSQAQYFKILEMKTAELFALSCELAAFLSKASVEQREALREFGVAFGTAYQVYDDCVDLFGSERTAGKSLGTDLAKGKLTLPVLCLLERADAADRGQVQDLIESWQPGAMPRMAELLAEYDALSASLAILGEFLERARQSLRAVPVSDGRESLLSLTEYLCRQTDALGQAPESSV